MGTSRDDFVKYPRTPRLFGSKGADDDKHLGPAESLRVLGALIEVVYVEPPLPVIRDRNRMREQRVPGEVIFRLAGKNEPPTWTEAHSLRLVE